MIPKQKHLIKLLLFFLLISTFSCEDEYPVLNNQETSLGGLESLEIRSGLNKVLLKGVVKDPNVSEVKIYWNGRSKSLVVPVSTSSKVDTIQEIIDNLEEKIYIFEAQTFNDAGESSEVVSAGAQVFGSDFVNNAGNREVLGNALVDSLLDVTYSLADKTSGIIGTKFIYENTSGESKELFLGPDDNSISISDFKSGSSYKYRSLFVPSLLAIDTIYSEYAESTPVPMPKLVFVTDDSNDNEQIEWLREQGFHVTTYYNSSFGSAPQEDIDMLNAVDLVIIGRSGNSGDFDGEEKTGWNALTVPLILNSQWAARDNRMNWFNNDGNPAAYDPGGGAIVRAQIQQPGDIAFEGVTLDNNLLPWLNTPVNLLYVDSTTPTNGEVLAVGAPGDAESEEGGAMLFVRFELGTEFYTGAGDAPAGPRTYFGFGADTDASYYWQLTDETKQVYLNEIKRMLELF
ncbi:DUF4998 domain-containing protein [Galbibacter sp. EGI 63066]|uniref:DUF4998 domain-containing protein n=1 Tax=Galbibacter sp. EGI 63066 TaxID=2993559 RepID=UPI002248B0CC|nr:DUF4998 domain-containing protein [Galbibacter sp. EGI 63066]MCX2679824.1 DUF4998 domain-containing protein [Galbibacter sp. EGI 63066]